MNYNFISQLLDNGISEEELIASLSKSMPRLAKKARQMFFGGWSPKDVLGMFSKDKEVQKVARKGLKPVTPSEMAAMHLQNSYNNIPQSAGQESKEKLTEFTKQAAPYALGAIASPLAGSVIQSALERALPQKDKLIEQSADQIQNQPQMPTQSLGSVQTPNDESLSSSLKPPLISGNANNIPEPANIQQAKEISNPKEYLEKKGVLQAVNESLKRGNNPEQVAAELGIKRTGRAKIDPEMLKNIEEYASLPKEDESQNLLKPTELVDKQAQEQPTPTQEQPKIEKKSIVNTPQGVGEVREIRNGKALVEVDGKLHKIKEEELEAEPEEVRNAQFDFDLNDVPEGLRSAPLNEVYLPYDKRHVTVKYNAGLKPIRYLYFRKDGQPINNNYINKIVQGLQLPVSSGKSFWGVWNGDESDSRGAANYEELVKNSQEEGEKDDPSKEYWFIKEEALYEHPYMEKKGKEELRHLEKKFNEERKKSKKKRA